MNFSEIVHQFQNPKSKMSSTAHALKEWSVAVKALEEGQTIMLLRKGGIRDRGNRFEVAHRQILLYPTYEHQNPQLLKAEYASQITPVPSGWHPQSVRIGSWADITDILCVSEPASLDRLLPYHIWNEQFVRDRFGWKPKQPLYILLLRAYRLPQPVTLPYRLEYGGCRSWIDLAEPISLSGGVPAVGEQEYQQQIQAIHAAIEPASLV
jgi:hypothetical protein